MVEHFFPKENACGQPFPSLLHLDGGFLSPDVKSEALAQDAPVRYQATWLNGIPKAS